MFIMGDNIDNLMVIQKSYSHSTIETSEELNEIPAAVAKKKQIMSSMTNDRQFPFRTIVKFWHSEHMLPV